MPATGTEGVTRCRRCHAWLHHSDLSSVWIDDSGWDSCDNTGDSHEPISACRVVDQILAWADKSGKLLIHEGDLVLRDWRFELIDRIYYKPTENIRVRVEFAGRNVAEFIDPMDPVAVRRYLIEPAI
jgi:hypothetical protein